MKKVGMELFFSKIVHPNCTAQIVQPKLYTQTVHPNCLPKLPAVIVHPNCLPKLYTQIVCPNCTPKLYTQINGVLKSVSFMPDFTIYQMYQFLRHPKGSQTSTPTDQNFQQFSFGFYSREGVYWYSTEHYRNVQYSRNQISSPCLPWPHAHRRRVLFLT